MMQRVHLITLGVEDLDRAATFYDALGWSREDGPGEVVAYNLYGATLGLFPRHMLAAEQGRDLPRGSGAMTLACNVRDRDEIDGVVDAARAAGATIIRAPFDTDWGGRSSYFEDLDGHVWECAWNPFSPPGAEGQFQWGGA